MHDGDNRTYQYYNYSNTLSSKRLVLFCCCLLFINLLFVTLFIKLGSLDKYVLTIEKGKDAHPAIKLPPDFLSFGVDASEFDLFMRLMKNERFLNLTKALSPAHLRFGGTLSDRLIFSQELVTNVTCESCVNVDSSLCKELNKLCLNKQLPYFIMTGSQWMQMCKFVDNAQLKLLFSFNVLLRDGDKWDDTNARELLEYSRDVKCNNVDWQLGNEPNSFLHVFNMTVTPHQLAQDFAVLRKLLNKLGYDKSVLVGPDTTRPQPGRPSCLEYMVQFLGNASHANDVRSWHQYYLNSRTAKLEDFWAPSTFDLLRNQLEAMKTSTTPYDKMPMWLTETSSAYGGGAPGLSDTFSSSPLWLDKLGLSALYNVSTVVRQSLVGGHYDLVDKEAEPLPDWWVSVLYKKLVGDQVLNVRANCSKNQRFYAHCTNREYTTDKSAITIFGLNLDLTKLKFVLNGTAFTKESVVEEFAIGVPSNNRKSKTVLLNGRRLKYSGEMQGFKPRVLEDPAHITISPYSIAFWVVKNTSVEICN